MKPVTFFLAALLYLMLFVALPFLAIQINYLLGLPVWQLFPLQILSLLVLIFSVGSIVQSYVFFRSLGKGTPSPFEPPKKLVITGLYKYTRNPMLLAYSLMVLAEFLFLGHISLFLYFLLLVLSFHLYVVLWEEKELVKRFGEDYLHYAKAVPRCIPNICRF